MTQLFIDVIISMLKLFQVLMLPVVFTFIHTPAKTSIIFENLINTSIKIISLDGRSFDKRTIIKTTKLIQLTNFTQMRRLDANLNLRVVKLKIIKKHQILRNFEEQSNFAIMIKNLLLTFCKRLQKVSNFPNIYISENSNGFSEGSSSNFCLVF